MILGSYNNLFAFLTSLLIYLSRKIGICDKGERKDVFLYAFNIILLVYFLIQYFFYHVRFQRFC